MSLYGSFLLSYTFFSLVQNVLHPRISIYKHGITKAVFPIFTDKEGAFVAFADMESFSVSRKRHTCVIMLHNRDSPLRWISWDPRDILPVIGILRAVGIPETE